MFATKNIDNSSPAMDFDPPHSAKGAIFPISRGLLNTMGKNDDFGISKIQVTDGSNNFRDALAEFSAGNLKVDYLELLCCQGCISGAGMTSKATRFKKRSLINDYVSQKFKNTDFEQWEKEKKRFSSLDISRTFEKREKAEFKSDEKEIEKVLVALGKTKESDMLDCGACGYHTCREHAIAVLNGFAEEEMCLPNTIEKLHDFIGELNTTNENLLSAKDALKQSEKLAHMGQLSAGIAHELNNPLGVITMYSNILIEESDKEDSIREDLQLIVEQAERCKRIVGGLLNFARKNQVILNATNIEELCKRSLQSVVKPNNIKAEVLADLNDPMVFVDKEQMLQVFTNLEKNAFEAMPNGGSLQISITDGKMHNEVEILIKDSGSGISEENLKKIFTPFFTTKGVSKGTGLGLPLIYGIIKMHKGRISVTSNDDANKGITGTEFKIILPRNPDNIKLKV
jgi:signal transduction histidine kinase